MKRKLVFSALSLLAVLLLAGCKDDAKVKNGSAPTADLVSVEAALDDPTLYVPNSVSLAVDGTFSDDTVESILSQVTFTSSDESVATVSADGALTAVGVGVATITAEEPETGLSASVDIEVPGIDVSSGAALVTISGSISSSDSTWNRPDQFCAADGGSSTYYDKIVLSNPGADDQTVEVRADWTDDGILLLYEDSFSAGSPLANCITGQDDYFSSNASRTGGVVVPAGSQVILAASAFADLTATGAYTLQQTTTTRSNFTNTTFSFENGTMQGWTSTGLWHNTDQRSFSGSNSIRYAYAGTTGATYDTGAANTGEFRSGSFVVGGSGFMEFYYMLFDECGQGGDCAPWYYDALYVEISTNGGLTWSILDILPGETSTFVYRSVDLNGYFGQTVNLRFLFDATDASLNNYEGAYLDYIRIY
jgi:hypothetical protein